MKLIAFLIIFVTLLVLSAHAADSVNPEKCPLITTETFAEVPSDRTRKILGVCEEVTITTTEAANWRVETAPGSPLALPNGTLFSPPSNVLTVDFKAGDRMGPVVVVAHIIRTNMDCKISFQIISPDHITLHDPNPIYHIFNTTSGGFLANRIHVYPDTVSFYNIEIQEGSAVAVATGVFSSLNGQVHMPGKEWGFRQNNDSRAGDYDKVWIPGMMGVSGEGRFRWGIPLTYGCSGETLDVLMGTIVQVGVANSLGNALISKGDLNVPVPLSAPSVIP